MIVTTRPGGEDGAVRRPLALHALPRLPAPVDALGVVQGPRELVELYPSLIPSDPTFENYRIAFTENGLVHAAWNSLKVATATAVLTIVMGLPAAYVIARRPGILSRMALGWILVSQMFPLILIIIPLFLLLRTSS